MLGPGRLRGERKEGQRDDPSASAASCGATGFARNTRPARSGAGGAWPGRGPRATCAFLPGGRVYRRVHSAHSHGAFAGQRVERGPRLCSVACGFLETVPSRLPVHEQEGGSCLFSLCSGLRGVYQFDSFFKNQLCFACLFSCFYLHSLLIFIILFPTLV